MNTKRFSIVLALVSFAAALTGCNEPQQCRNTAGDLITCPGNVADGSVPMDGTVVHCFDPVTGMSTGLCLADSGNASGVLVATLKSGIQFVTTGTASEGVTCTNPIVVGADISPLTGPSCTLSGQTVTCTSVPHATVLDVRSCIKDASGTVRIINLSSQSSNCSLQVNEWQTITFEGQTVPNTVGYDVDSSPTALYCRIKLP